MYIFTELRNLDAIKIIGFFVIKEGILPLALQDTSNTKAPTYT